MLFDKGMIGKAYDVGLSNVTSPYVETIAQPNTPESINSASSITIEARQQLTSTGDMNKGNESKYHRANLAQLSSDVIKQVQIAEKDFAHYLAEKRRINLTNLIKALSIGANTCCDEERSNLDKEFQLNFLPSLIQCYASVMLHTAERVFGKDAECGQIPDNSVHTNVKSEIEESIIHLVEKIKEAILSYLEKKQADLTMCALDALSISVLDREEYWRQKTNRDVEKLHALRLQEVLNEVPVNPSPSKPQHFQTSDSEAYGRKCQDSDLSLSMWIEGVSSPGSSSVGTSQRHRNILTHSPISAKSSSGKRERRGDRGNDGKGPREGFLRIRDINSSNILRDDVIDVAPVALGVGGNVEFSDDDEYDSDVHLGTPRKGFASKSHSTQEYFTQARRCVFHNT